MKIGARRLRPRRGGSVPRRVVGLLRAIAINILAVLRALSWLKQGNQRVTPTWKTVIEQALLVLCEPLLDMRAFNALEA